jgi:succinyl-diaminopimelate desuccinylase
VTRLELSRPVDQLTAQLVDIDSVSGNEAAIADAVEHALLGVGRFAVDRSGNTVVARTELGLPNRVAIAGHLDTVPVNDNLPSRNDGTRLHGLGSCDMKGGVAVALALAASVAHPVNDVTYIFYECEEVEAERNGLTHLARDRPDLIAADFAILMEPSNAVVEAGCQGTIHVDVTAHGVRAHSARSWNGVNAIHGAVPILDRLTSYVPAQPVIDGLRYHEGLNAVAIAGGVAGNVIPDSCTVGVNYRFAPDRSVDEAYAHMREVFDGFDLELSDSAPAAMPGLSVPAAAAFVEAVGGRANPKFGWTDVARFSALGVPAVNFGPGDPHLAHKQDEFVPLDQVVTVERQLRSWLGADA